MTEAVTVIPGPGPDGIVDFTSPRATARFRIDDDVFDIVAGLPAMKFMEFVQLGDVPTDNPEQARQLFQRMFRLVLQPGSAETFLARMEDSAHPVTIEQIQLVIPYVLESLGMRPTEPSAPSSNGSGGPASGTNSTVNASLPELPSAVYPFPTSSTTATGS